MTKIVQVPYFRIDFAAMVALIGPPQFSSHPIMPADLKESTPIPLAEISQGPSAFEEFLDKNQKNLVILSIMIALGVSVWIVYSGIQKSRQETAGADLEKAQDTHSLQAIITEHVGTAAASSAMVLLADHHWTEGQQDSAIATLKKFIASNPKHPALPTAMASMGSKLMVQGKTAEATKIFEEIVSNADARFIAPYALLSLGDIAQTSGDLEKAEASYSRVTKEFPESSFVETANRRIGSLKTKAPIEIAPPPPPPTPPAATPGAPGAPGVIPALPAPGIPPVTPPANLPAPVSPETPAAPAPETTAPAAP